MGETIMDIHYSMRTSEHMPKKADKSAPTDVRMHVLITIIVPFVQRKLKERENLYDGIWLVVPAPIVVSGQVLLDRDPGALDRVHDSAIQL
jgi:hypothetical protein